MSTPTIAKRVSSRSKHGVILEAAIDYFGEVGYEHTKWSTIADQVGIGQTALYHYFESKAHCLLTIMRLELEQSVARFHSEVDDKDDVLEAFEAAVSSAYLNASPRDALQRRVLQNHMDLLSTPRQSEKEEVERLRSRDAVREIEQLWTSLIQRGVDDGHFTDRDAVLSARMVLSLVIGVWRWYRPGGDLTLEQISPLMCEAALRIVRA